MKVVTAGELEDREPESAPFPMTRERHSRDFSPDSSRVRLSDVDGIPRSTAGRDVRRFVIRLLGFAAVGAVIWGAAYIAREPRARAEIATWGTMGNPKLAGTAVRGVRSVVDTVRSIAK